MKYLKIYKSFDASIIYLIKNCPPSFANTSGHSLIISSCTNNKGCQPFL